MRSGRSSIAWAVLHTALAVAAALCLGLGAAEDRLVERFVAGSVEAGMTESERAVRITQDVQSLMDGRMEHFAPARGGALLPATVTRLMAEGGPCGARSRVLARALQVAGFDARIVQMKVAGHWGAHIAVVARVDGRWVPLDGLFGLAFRREDGSLASLEDVRSNFAAYRAQAPPRYDERYDYAELRYTNWQKVPVLMPALRGTLDLVMGAEAADRISLRSHTLNVQRSIGLALLAWWGLLAVVHLGVALRRRAG